MIVYKKCDGQLKFIPTYVETFDERFLRLAEITLDTPSDAEWLQAIGIEPLEPKPALSGLTPFMRAMLHEQERT